MNSPTPSLPPKPTSEPPKPPKSPTSLTTLASLLASHKYYFSSLLKQDLTSIPLHPPLLGNFPKYYLPSPGAHSPVKARLKLLPPAWFTNKKVLDIGCNDGTFTIALGLEFEPSLLLGVDIDYRLVARAVKNVHRLGDDLEVVKWVHRVNDREESKDDGKEGEIGPEVGEKIGPAMPVKIGPEMPTKIGPEMPVKIGPEMPAKIGPAMPPKIGPTKPPQTEPTPNTDKNPTPENIPEEKSSLPQKDISKTTDSKTHDTTEEAILAKIEELPRSLRLSLSVPSVLKAVSNTDSFSKGAKNFLYERLCFRTENFIANLEPVFEKFDVILCLKTAKWIHLNFKDAGIKALFHKAYESLEAGGLFILDTSNWKGYKKRKAMGDVLKANFDAIEFKPADFDTYLKESVGFEFHTALKFPEEEKQRPLLVYKKPE